MAPGTPPRKSAGGWCSPNERMDLVELLKRPEGKTLEFKRDLSTPEGALKTIVAFANTAGGALLVDVEDKSRHVRSVRDPLDLEERCTRARAARTT